MRPQAKYVVRVGTPPHHTYPVEPARPSIASATMRREFNSRKPLPPSLRIDRNPTRRSPRWGSGVWSYHFPGAYAPWLLTGVPLGLGESQEVVKGFPSRVELATHHTKKGISPISDQRRSALFFRIGVRYRNRIASRSMSYLYDSRNKFILLPSAFIYSASRILPT